MRFIRHREATKSAVTALSSPLPSTVRRSRGVKSEHCLKKSASLSPPHVQVLAALHKVHDGAQRPVVGGHVVSGFEQHLGSHVTVRAHGDIRHLTGRQPLGTAKVGDAHRAIVVHKHVAALQVAVNDAEPPVQVGQTLHDMAGNIAFRLMCARTVLMAILHERVQVLGHLRGTRLLCSTGSHCHGMLPWALATYSQLR